FVGVPAHEIQSSAAAMQRALRDQPLPEALCRQLLEVANRSARPRVVNVPPGQAAPILAQSVTNRDYRSLAGLGIDSVLEIRIEPQRFKADESAPNPPMSFDATGVLQPQETLLRVGRRGGKTLPEGAQPRPTRAGRDDVRTTVFQP